MGTCIDRDTTMQAKLVFHVGEGKRDVASLDRALCMARDQSDVTLLSVTATDKVVKQLKRCVVFP